MVGRLKQLRLARGLSLEDLAAEMGGIVTRQALSKYELGLSKPSALVLNRLAGALGVKAAYLWSEPSIHCKFIAYRKGTGLAKTEQQRVESVVCQMLEDRVRLQQMIQGTTEVDLPVKGFKVRTIEDTEDFAKGLRYKWNLGLGPIPTVTGTLEDRFVHVFEIEASQRFDGISAVAYDSEKHVAAAAVVSRKSLPGGRQRLNLAHELGHLVLDMPKNLDEEKVAFRFAGAFLAPDEVLFRELGQKRSLVQAAELFLLKQKYGMSIQSLVYRLHDLGVISDQHHKQWWMTINREGWKKEEPLELKPEKSEWLKKNVLRALSEGFITKGDAMKALGESVEVQEPITLVERQAFLKLPIEERRKIMAKQAKEMAADYKTGKMEDLETGEILEY
ncbi:MAG: XRE family transcriptional regulator [Syntrophorhabdaceae bacterium]|jgi:Zn-dependent peptidase ImmA (M78 family)/transcriptional regulator with XRE-family HTH domain|nr:XRE family transcriptional regulator [Syntrophorhabdaceae bacterium]MDD5243054.1 XRE family transcriptional regulator [Syntrophorhabdaceae bacterium]